MELSLPPAEAQFLSDSYAKGSNHIIEYGTGGSTVLALRNKSNTVIGVDTDKNWLDAVDREISRMPVHGKFYPLHIDLGPTGPWGYPTQQDLRTVKNYPKYALEPWSEAMKSSLIPNLVLIDGRFRVACLIASLLLCQSDTIVMFDDYTDRPPYQVVEKVIKPADIIGRMAVFHLTPRQTMELTIEMISLAGYFMESG